MNYPAALARDDLLRRIVEQFEEVATEIAAPYKGKVLSKEGEAVLRVRAAGHEDHDVLRVIARFVDGGTVLEEKLSLLWEWQGETTEIVALGWNESAPDVQAGLDSPADYGEGAYAIGQVTQGLRADVMQQLKTQARFMTRLSASQAPRLPRHFIEASADGAKPLAPDTHVTRKSAETGHTQTVVPGIELLRVALGELAELGGLSAERVFAGFMKAAASGSALKQGDVASYLQGALTELLLFHKVCREGPEWMRPRTRIHGGALRDAVLRAKSALFERNDDVRRQVAREMVTGMRLFYGQALSTAGMTKAEADERLDSAFGNAGAIVNEAVKIFGGVERTKRRGLTRLLGRNSLD